MFMKTMASAAAICIASTAAHAVSVTPFATPLSAGDSTFGNATAVAFEDFGSTALSFTAATDLAAQVSATVNPFMTNVSGAPANSIALSYSVNGGAVVALPLTTIPVGPGNIGGAGMSIVLAAGDVLSYFISGVAGQSGNQVTFAVETAPVPVPAALLFGLSGMAAFGAMRRKKS